MRFLAWHVDCFKCRITERGRSPRLVQHPGNSGQRSSFVQDSPHHHCGKGGNAMTVRQITLYSQPG